MGSLYSTRVPWRGDQGECAPTAGLSLAPAEICRILREARREGIAWWVRRRLSWTRRSSPTGIPKRKDGIARCASSNGGSRHLRHLLLRSGTPVLSPRGGTGVSHIPVVRWPWGRMPPPTAAAAGGRSERAGGRAGPLHPLIAALDCPRPDWANGRLLHPLLEPHACPYLGDRRPFHRQEPTSEHFLESGRVHLFDHLHGWGHASLS